MKAFDLTGHKFNRWTVISRSENTPQGQARWLCRCDCGNERALKSIVIRRGISKSCGCFNREVQLARSTKHGHATGGVISPTYHSWAGMVARCTNPKHKSYAEYGGKGISICERWMTFANFLADMGEKPRGTSIERNENDRGYEPSNCCWATSVRQARNKSNNRLVTAQGQTRTLAEWSEILGIHPATLSDRARRGWSDEEIVSTVKKSEASR